MSEVWSEKSWNRKGVGELSGSESIETVWIRGENG